MFQTFTGSGRKPRQVNLSGRNSNPFAKYGQGQNAVVNAQHDREARQRERQRTQAARLLQRSWRGYRSRESTSSTAREEWDRAESESENSIRSSSDGAEPYQNEGTTYQQLAHLLRFCTFPQDLERMRRYLRRQAATIRDGRAACNQGPWPKAYLRLESKCLDSLDRGPPLEAQEQLIQIIRFINATAPDLPAQNSAKYFRTLRRCQEKDAEKHLPRDLIEAPLRSLSAATPEAYQNLAYHILTIPDLRNIIGGQASLDEFASMINCKILANAVAELLRAGTWESRSSSQGRSARRAQDDRDRGLAWLLTHVIYFYRHAFGFNHPERFSSQEDFIFVVASLLSSTANFVEVENTSSLEAEESTQPPSADSFINEQITSLVNQASIGGLVSRMVIGESPKSRSDQAEEHSRLFANYILTLLRLFPRRSDEIRMWLYLGSTANVESTSSKPASEAPSVIQYFWQATVNTEIFKEVYNDPRAAIKNLRPVATHSKAQDLVDDQWRVILIFVELYLFILKVMDDEEFFARGPPGVSSATVGKPNGLDLENIKHLTTFLKHLGFSMYYFASDILASSSRGESVAATREIATLFKDISEEVANDSADRTSHVAGLRGLSLDYMKGLVTGLLRAIYERDSRRPFLPKGHWLLTSIFDMTNFIDAVVEEEGNRNQVEEAEEEDEPDSDLNDDSNDPLMSGSGLIGTSRARRHQKIENLLRKQRKDSRRRYLQAVAPRLEILQNMPFLIPFTTRVQIFRRFVHLDQVKRRHGITDPEMWRIAQLQFDPQPLARHHAKIRREHEFHDAYEQFFDLGPSLKEPIHITFVDQFDTPEAGIDGGGVTKEFLTSVTNQAFGEQEGIRLFAENEKHLLYPNPCAMDEQRELLKELGYGPSDPIWRSTITDLLQRYEFLGRIIGKCLYEGILVDIRFAGFFLLKWALTGGTGSAPRESGYRANINDLRDFDEELYQGLIQLKNHPGNVDDFALNFTVTDTATLPPSTNPPRAKTKTITRPLKPAGASTPVTNANRLVYISYIARHRLTTQPLAVTTAFLRGLSALVPPSWLSMFNHPELQTLVAGAPAPIDVSDLRSHTVYGGVYTIGDDGLEHPSVRVFWEVMLSLDDADRRKVLKFVTSTPRAPLLGFGSLNPRFSIRDSGGDESRLPSTSTCVNLLKLPRYGDVAVCRGKLLQAVNAGAGFDLS